MPLSLGPCSYILHLCDTTWQSWNSSHNSGYPLDTCHAGCTGISSSTSTSALYCFAALFSDNSGYCISGAYVDKAELATASPLIQTEIPLWVGMRLLQAKVERQLCGLTHLRHVSGTQLPFSQVLLISAIGPRRPTTYRPYRLAVD